MVDALGPPDLTGPSSPTPLTGCAAVPFPPTLAPNVIGELTVVDAPAGPRSKDDCKHGDYARFGFENQGRCVASVVHARLSPRRPGG